MVRTAAAIRWNIRSMKQANPNKHLFNYIIKFVERRCTWRRLLKTSLPSTPNHAHSATSTDTELSTLDTHELWLPDSRWAHTKSYRTNWTAFHFYCTTFFSLFHTQHTWANAVYNDRTTPIRCWNVEIVARTGRRFIVDCGANVNRFINQYVQ